MSRVTDRNDWFDIWFDDKDAMIATMIRNMTSDLDAGYDYFSPSIIRQQIAIGQYKMDFDAQVDKFAYMDDKDVNRWCYYDMKKRGVID